MATRRIDGETINGEDIQCPECGSKNVWLIGNSVKACCVHSDPRKVFERPAADTRFVDGFDLERIECLACDGSFDIIDHAVYELTMANQCLMAERDAMAERLRRYMAAA